MKATSAEVQEHIRETDTTRDGEHINRLVDEIAKYPVWKLVRVPVSSFGSMMIYDSEEDWKLVDEYAEMGMASMPAVVIVPVLPSDRAGDDKWFVIDGTHRIAAAQELKAKTILAFVPVKLKRDPPAEEIEGFHCTSLDNAEAILREGFKGVPYFPEFYDEHFSECINMLKIAGDERDGLETLYAAKPDKAVELVQDAWLKRFGGGTLIWISAGQPATEFGSACLSVKLPKSARKVTTDWTYGDAYWVPTPKIAAKRFRMIED